MNQAGKMAVRTVFLVLILSANAVCAQYSGGSGTVEEPYQIATAEDLITLGESPGDYDKHFILTADIDLDPTLPGRRVFDRAVIAADIDDGQQFDGTFFSGVFDGNGHAISHLVIDGGGYLGLFGQLGSTAEVKNMGLTDVNITSSRLYVGGLVADNNGSIVASYSTGTVVGDSSIVGGLVGCNEGSITNCHSAGTLTGGGSVGGLVGDNGGSITNCGSSSVVSGDRGVGGLVGTNSGSINTSFSAGSVSGNSDVGGLLGYIGDNLLITSCYSTASVSGDRFVGGLVGQNQTSSFTSCYSTGAVVGEGGGLLGWSEGGVTTSCFWDTETSGQSTSYGGIGLTTIEMMDPYVLGLNKLLINDPNWVLDAGRDYPRLAWEGTPGQVIPEPVIDWFDGQGTEQEPYRIDTAEQLILLGQASVLWDKHFVLGADIDLDPNLPGGKVFDGAVIATDVSVYGWFQGTAFTGVFDGNGHTVSNLTIRGDSNLGLFGQLGSGATISNIALEAADVNGTGDYVGGLVGFNRGGSITSSYSTGIVSGERCVGELVGYNTGRIMTCYSTATVSGEREVGGLVGSNRDGSITTSYSTGIVSGNDRIGGLVGSNYDGSITTSVWDIETSGLTISGGGVGLTTAEMMDPYMLGLNGFANDPNWVLDAGRNYPTLAWEGTPGQVIPEPIIEWLDGQGTDQEPYRISKADQLILLTRAGGLWDKHFVLVADIELDPSLPTGWVFSQAVFQVFSGVFDGDGHTISHLTITGESYLGLFGQLGSGAIISHLALEAVNVNGTDNCVGGLVGYNDKGSITNCYCTGSVSGNGEVGGLVGRNEGSIATSYSTGTVTGNREVGGLVGSNGRYSKGGIVVNSYSTGTVNGRENVGGLVGRNFGSITNCYSTGSVSGTGRIVGGLVGSNWGSITTSYSTGTVSGNSYVGGLVGSVFGGSITMSYSTGIVSGETYVGGLVGSNYGSDITSSFWDFQTSGQTTSDSGTGKTTAEMQTAGTFLNAGWDFVDETINGSNDIWTICEGRGYPRLWWETLYVDDDAPDDPGPGDSQISDPLEDGRQAHPFDTIQEAIDFAPDYLTILVQGGVYSEPIDFKGKAITVTSGSDVAVLETPGDYAVSFLSGEGPDSVLKNFVIRNSTAAVFIPGSSPTIRNLTLVNNEYGITAYTWAEPDISNCIFWNNSEVDLFQCEARYSCIEDGGQGRGNISADPLFVDAENGDYHLRSEGWCWSTKTKSWTYDDYATSPCIDSGDPASPLYDEPMSVPRDPDNIYGINLRINMGAYGGTAQASMPPLGWLEELSIE